MASCQHHAFKLSGYSSIMLHDSRDQSVSQKIKAQ